MGALVGVPCFGFTAASASTFCIVGTVHQDGALAWLASGFEAHRLTKTKKERGPLLFLTRVTCSDLD